MIARDEGPRIGRALLSARPHVDRMIVLDTGSLDETMDMAEACGAEVHRFTWRDDFSAARNAALDLSDADWNLVLDADEWVEGPADALGPAILRPGGGFVGQLQILNHIVQPDGESIARSWISRVLPRGVRYEGRIHEQPASNLRVRRLNVRIGHDGYRPEGLARKAGRNEALLMREIEASPRDGYLWFQLGREHQARERWREAADCLAIALPLTPSDAPFRHALVVRAITALKSAEQFDEAVALADAELANWTQSPDFHYAVGDLYLEWASRNPDRALKDFLPIVEWAWKRCLEIGEREDLEGSVQGRGGYMPAHNLSVMFGALGMDELASRYAAMAERLRPGR